MELIDRVKTTFEYLWRDEIKVKSKEPGGELVQTP
jgi:cupin superfamily acireductone dioxygenase involved in methionine salvage